MATAAIVATGSWPGPVAGPPEAVQVPRCDAQLSAELGLSTTGICLQDVQVSVSTLDASAFIVPVIVMKTGTTATIEILYLLSSETLGHTGPIENVTSSDAPVALSVPSGRASDKVTFSNASVVFSDRNLIVYSYTVRAPAGSDGYYAILPPYYYGTYPALALGAHPGRLNASELSAWGYSGVMQSAEFALPSTIVGTGGLGVVNATVPMIPVCPNPACTIISHSGF